MCVFVFVVRVCEWFKRTYYCSVLAPGTDVWFCKYRCKSLFRKPRRVMKTFLRFWNCVMPKVFPNSCEDSGDGSSSSSAAAPGRWKLPVPPRQLLPDRDAPFLAPFKPFQRFQSAARRCRTCVCSDVLRPDSAPYGPHRPSYHPS